MRGPVFEQARTATGFTAVSVDAQSGTVVWPDGADLTPDTLYQRLRTGLWPEQAPPREQALAARSRATDRCRTSIVAEDTLDATARLIRMR